MPIKLITSGGGSAILTPTSKATDYTLTVPAVTANVVTTADSNTITQAMFSTGLAGNGPSFSAVSTAGQTIGASYTKIQWNIEEWDTANCFDSTTNYRFTPNVAGYYHITCFIRPNNNYVQSTALYKNGTIYRYVYGSSYSFSLPLSTLVYCNGTTDYLEIYFYSQTSITVTNGTNPYDNFFQGYLVRSA